MLIKNRIDNRIRPFAGFPFEVDSLIDHLMGERSADTADFYPSSNVTETENGYQVVLELPGITADEVSVEIKDGRLEISGERKLETESVDGGIVRSEIRIGKFRRAFDFATLVDAEKIAAEFENGMLTVTLPKSENVLPRKIDIKSIA